MLHLVDFNRIDDQVTYPAGLNADDCILVFFEVIAHDDDIVTQVEV